MDYGFCDLCINASENNQDLRDILSKLCEAGYNTIAINQHVDETVFDNEKKKKKKVDENDTVGPRMPDPINVQDLVDEFKGKLRILNRISFSFSDPMKTHSLNQLPILKDFNLYAVVPKTQNAFQFACSQLNADIISINPAYSALKINRKLYLQAVEKGIHFEILYSDVIKTATRKFAIHYSHLFYTFGRSKNVIISSGINCASLIRNPYDIINLGRLLGLTEVKAKHSILQQAHRVLLKGEGRRSGKAFFKIQNNVKADKLEGNDCDTKVKKIKL